MIFSVQILHSPDWRRSNVAEQDSQHRKTRLTHCGSGIDIPGRADHILFLLDCSPHLETEARYAAIRCLQTSKTPGERRSVLTISHHSKVIMFYTNPAQLLTRHSIESFTASSNSLHREEAQDRTTLKITNGWFMSLTPGLCF